MIQFQPLEFGAGLSLGSLGHFHLAPASAPKTPPTTVARATWDCGVDLAHSGAGAGLVQLPVCGNFSSRGLVRLSFRWAFNLAGPCRMFSVALIMCLASACADLDFYMGNGSGYTSYIWCVCNILPEDTRSSSHSSFGSINQYKWFMCKLWTSFLRWTSGTRSAHRKFHSMLIQIWLRSQHLSTSLNISQLYS